MALVFSTSSSVCSYLLSAQEKSAEWLSPRSCLSWSELASTSDCLGVCLLGCDNDRRCVFAYPRSSSVLWNSNTSLYSGGSSPSAIVDAMTGPWLPAQCPYHMMTKSNLRRQAHRDPKATLCHRLTVTWLCTRPMCGKLCFQCWSHPAWSPPQPKPGKDSSADIGPAMPLFSLLFFSCLSKNQ